MMISVALSATTRIGGVLSERYRLSSSGWLTVTMCSPAGMLSTTKTPAGLVTLERPVSPMRTVARASGAIRMLSTTTPVRLPIELAA
jgi:hypothetical protein